MPRKLPNLVLANSDLEIDSAGAAFRILMAYRGPAAGIHALDTCQMLLSQFGDEFQFRISGWTFDQLQHEMPKLDAIRDAIEADVVIIAAGAHEELPAEIKLWMETWIPQKRGQGAALIALLDSNSEGSGSSPAQAYLKNAATSAGMDFLPRQIQTAGKPAATASSSSLLTRLPPMLIEQLDEPAPDGWGINE